jgi:hypothetical protein
MPSVLSVLEDGNPSKLTRAKEGTEHSHTVTVTFIDAQEEESRTRRRGLNLEDDGARVDQGVDHDS